MEMDDDVLHPSPVAAHYGTIIFRQYIFIIVLCAVLVFMSVFGLQQFWTMKKALADINELKQSKIVEVGCINDDLLFVRLNNDIYTVQGQCSTARVN